MSSRKGNYICKVKHIGFYVPRCLRSKNLDFTILEYGLGQSRELGHQLVSCLHLVVPGFHESTKANNFIVQSY